ncbi:MAG TPA: HAD-IB family hydrolase, partial [Candidatus Didemnitutus sp.]|nr:HAD-IB family hydrolase [Candidatus Didemnitutus sp.]
MDSTPRSTPASSPSASRPVACFDLDGTLVKGDSFLPFLLTFTVRQGGWWKLLILPGWLLLYALRLVSDRRAKQGVLKLFLRGRSRLTIEGHAEWFSLNWGHARLNGPVAAKLQEHLAAGHRAIIVSASPDVYVPALARHFGVPETICTRVEYEGNICTGRIVGDNCKGETKVSMLRAHLAAEIPAGSFAYGDTDSDLPMFRAVEHSTLVSGSQLTPVNATMKQPVARSRASWLLPLVCVIVWASSVPATDSRVYRYGWDSAAYVEATQSIVRGDGVMHRVIGGVDLPLWVPMSLWPPGYPLLIAAVHSLGVPAPEAGVLVSLIGTAIFVALQAWLCVRFLGPMLALPVAATVIFMPALYQVSTKCLSDAAYMALATASLVLLLKWSDQLSKPRALLAAAGFLAGAAWATRTVGLTLLAAEGAFLALGLLGSSPRTAVKNLAWWAVPAALPVCPVLWRNLSTFGVLNPYTMPPSNLTLRENIEATFGSFLHDLLPYPPFYVYWSMQRAILLGAAAAALVAWSQRRHLRLAAWRDLLLRHDRYLLFFGYAGMFLTVVIAARTKYWWGEIIYWRYLIPIYWIALIGFALLALTCLRTLRLPERSSRALVAAGCLGLAALQARAHLAWMAEPPANQEVIETVLGERARRFLVAAVPQHQIVLMCHAHLLRLHCNLNARKIPGRPFSAANYRREITWENVASA